MWCRGSKEGKQAAYTPFSVQNDSLASFMHWNNIPANHQHFSMQTEQLFRHGRGTAFTQLQAFWVWKDVGHAKQCTYIHIFVPMTAYDLTFWVKTLFCRHRQKKHTYHLHFKQLYDPLPPILLPPHRVAENSGWAHWFDYLIIIE